jgi:O-antigen/teichoic acid export membrane protein
VTQYLLIAVNQQGFLTKAFVVGVVVNLGANLLFIPTYGYRAAALILIPSELALLFPFLYCVRKNVGPIPWVDIVWRPLLAAGVMAAVIAPLRGFSLPLAVIAGFMAGGLVLALVGGFRHADFDVLRHALTLDKLRARWDRLRGMASL